MPRFFVSHSSQDYRQAIALQQWLVQQDPQLQNEIVIDTQQDGIKRLVRFKNALKEAKDSCEAVICLLSENWQASPEFANEYQFAMSLNKRILGARIEPLTREDPTQEWPQIDLFGEGGTITKVDIRDGRPVEFLSDGLYELHKRIVAAGNGPESFDWPAPTHRQRAPYRGWTSLDEDDAGVFFGRDAQLLAGLDALRGMRRSGVQRLFVVLGVSAVGKSAFLRAGLLPRLRRDDRDFLLLDIVRPQRQALTGENGLARAIWATRGRHGLTAPSLEEIERACLRGDPAPLRGWLQEVRQAKSPGQGPLPTLVLPIDQGEELFSEDAGAEAPVFLKLIAGRADTSTTGQTGGDDTERGSELGLIVVVTIRTNDYHLVQTAPQLVKLGSAVIDDLKPMTDTQLKEVITGPARRATRLQIQPALVKRLLEKCTATTDGNIRRPAHDTDTLPQLALTLARLYEDSGSGGELTLAHYEAMGGMGRAVQNEIDAILATDPAERQQQLQTLRAAFIPALATIDPDTEQPMRRLARFDDLPAASHDLIDALVKKQLLVKHSHDGQADVEVALQSLLHLWDDLAAWLQKEHEDFEDAKKLEGAAKDWRDNDRNPAWLLEGTRLQEAEELAAKPRFEDRLGTPSDYLEESRQREDERIAAEKKHQRVLRIILVVTLVVAAVAVGGFALAQYESHKARANYLSAVAQGLAQQGESMLAGLQGGGDVRALEQILAAPKIWPKADTGALFTAVVARQDTIKIMQTPGASYSVAVSPDGQRIASGVEDGSVRVWDFASGKPIGQPLTLTGHTGPVYSVAFSPHGHRIVSGSKDGTLRLWDASTGQLIGQPLDSHTDAVTSVAFSPRGHRIVSGSKDGTLRLWDAGTGQPIGEPLTGHKGPVESVAFSPDGTRIVSGGDDATVWVWDAGTRARVGEPLTGHTDTVRTVAFDHNGTRIVSGSDDTTLIVWDADTHEKIGHPLTDPNTDRVYSAAFSPDGTRIVSGGNDHKVWLWDVPTDNANTGKLIGTVRHDDAVRGVAFSPDGRRIVSASEDDTVRVWDAKVVGPLVDLTSGGQFPWDSTLVTGWVTSVAFSPDGNHVLAAARDLEVDRDGVHFKGGVLRLRDTNTGREIGSLAIDEGPDSARLLDPRVAFSPDGKHIVAAARESAPDRGEHGVLRMWECDPVSGEPIGQPRIPHTETGVGLTSVAFGPDGHRIVVGSADGTLQLWDVEAFKPIGEPLTGHKGRVNSVAFSPHGDRIVSGSYDGTLRLWDPGTGQPIGDPLTGHKGPVESAVFSPDGTRIVSGGYDQTLRLWDAGSRKPIGDPLTGHTDAVTGVAFSPDGKRVVSGSDDATLRMWDAGSGKSIGAGMTGHTHSVHSVAFSPDGKRVLSGSDDGTVRLWPAPPTERWRKLLCDKLTENLSHRQWQKWVNTIVSGSRVARDIPYTEVCPDLPDLQDADSG